MKKIVLSVSLALAAGSAMAAEHNYDDRWYLVPNVSFVKPDTDKDANSALAVGIGLGRFVTEKISVEVEFDRARFDLKNGGNLTQNNVGVMGRYHFDQKMGLTPYFGTGIGFVRNQKPTDFDATFSVAGGLVKEITDKVKLRTELRYRLENGEEQTFGDYMFNAGLNIALGEKAVESTQTKLVEKAPQLDSDNDGVSDANDRCPNSPAGSRVDASGCAIVDGDDDRDGVLNSKDACPHSRAGAVVDNTGCEVKVVIELQGVHFDTDKSTLKSSSITILNSAVKTLGEHGTIRVEVAGHTDSTGSDKYNQALSQRRAKVVYDYLSSHGVSDDRMTWKGYGESQPMATNDTDEGRTQNRRTELIVQ